MTKMTSLTHFAMSQADSDGVLVLQSSQSTMQYVIHSCPLAPDKFQGSVQLRDFHDIDHDHDHDQ